MIHVTSRNSIGVWVASAIAGIIAYSVAVGPARAGRPTADKVQHAASINRAVVGVLDAHLALEQWKREKLELLKNQGHSSWREVAEQQVVVETLRAYRIATVEYAALLRALDRRVEPGRNQQGDSPLPGSARDSVPPIKLCLPGSVRLVAWLEMDRLPADLAGKYMEQFRLSVKGENVLARELELAEQQLAGVRKRVRALETLAGKVDVTEELRRTKMERAIAAAEVEFHQERRRAHRLQAQPGAIPDEKVNANQQTVRAGEANQRKALVATMPASTAPLTCIDHQASEVLRAATLSLAAAEAEAVGELRAAEISLRRCQLHFNALQRLHLKGYASRRELDHARSGLSTAQRHVDQLKVQRNRLVHSCETLRAPSADSCRHDFDAVDDNVQVDELPLSLVAREAAVEHLVSLWRHRFAASARRGAIRAERTMLEELVRRLEATGLNDDGTRRELAGHRLDVEYCEAQLLAATERIRALRLEQTRFVQQMVQQFTACTRGVPEFETDSDFRTMRTTYTEGHTPTPDFQFVTLDAGAGRAASARAWPSYLESPAVIDSLNLCTVSEPTLNLPPSAQQHYGGRSSLAPAALLSRTRVTTDLFSPQWTVASPYAATPGDVTDYDPDHLSVDPPQARLRSRIPSYYDYYEFGRRRLDRRSERSRATRYGVPWYFPGSPSNFR